MVTAKMFIDFPDALTFEVSGKDAHRYLQNRLTQNFKPLELNRPYLAAALTPQGRSEVLFTVVASSPEHFFLVTLYGDAEKALESLKRYIVADRVSVTNRSQECTVVGVFGGAEAAPTEALARWKWPALHNLCEMVLVTVEDLPAWRENLTGAGFSIASPEEFHALRFRAAQPLYPFEVNTESLIAETGPHEAIAFGKGCYVGQEVIEKLDAVGKRPRTLVRLRLGDPVPTKGTPVSKGGVSIGKVVSCYRDPGTSEILAFSLCKTGAVVAGDDVECGDSRGAVL